MPYMTIAVDVFPDWTKRKESLPQLILMIPLEFKLLISQ